LHTEGLFKIKGGQPGI